ncbi:MAG TPA: sensor histidine kinase N-terminal domain-containing protein [Burkholderiales bacterium]|nr:sensor histidine kinase N-terminal domain-containing protein [Burkholderiales bacterium]
MLQHFFAGARDSLRAQLLWWVVPPVLGVVIVSAFISYTLALKFATEAYDTALFDAARSLAQQIQFGADGKATLDLPRAATEILESDPYDRIFYRVLDANGATVVGRDDVPPPAELPNRAEPVHFYNASIHDEPVRVGAYAIFVGPGMPRATVLFAETLVKRNRLSQKLLLTMLLPLITLTGLVAVLIGLGIRHALTPLQRLAAAISDRGWNNLSGIGSSGVPQEVRPLTAAIDGLMHRLAEALTVQQRFIAQAAHQLRTPMAGLTSQTDRALLASDINTIKPALEQLQLSARRVTRLVNQLLTLARAEPGSGADREFVTLDLSELVQQTCMEWVPEALHKNVDLGFAGESGPVPIRGDELLLTEMLNNLIDNALRYGARPGGAVTVRLSTTPRLKLSVEDDGTGIPESERTRVFDRFHRVPGSAPGGCGLGLAIVLEIARAHGAEVQIDTPRSGRGTIFSVIFQQQLLQPTVGGAARPGLPDRAAKAGAAEVNLRQ